MEFHLGKYEIRKTLGRGAAGTVYEAWDPAIARQVAIKTVKLPDSADMDDQEALTRFRREAQAAGRLTHPNIVGVFDYGETDDLAYIVMEYVDGESLKAVLDRKERFAPADIVRLMEELLAGLDFSHERGVVHRDIKPANLMLTQQGRIKIADFGIARIESSGLTQIGTIMGTPAYMSPEQFTGQVVDPRTDLYSAGVVLYQLLTGERPFEGSMSAIMQKALNTIPVRPSDIAVTAPAAFDAVVLRAMAKRPEQRFPTAAAFAAALREAAATPVADPDGEATLVRAPTPAPPIASLAVPLTASPVMAREMLPSATLAAGRSSLPMLGGVGGAILLMGGVAWFLLGAPEKVPSLPPAGLASAPLLVNPTPTQTTQPPPAVAFRPAEPSSPAPSQVPEITAPVVPKVAPMAAPVDRNALVAALAAIPCAMLDGNLSAAGQPTSLSGVIADGGPSADLTRELAAHAPDIRANEVQVFPRSANYCRVLDVLRPALARFGETGARLELRMADGHTRLTTNAPIRLQVRMADFAGELRVEYLSSDGNIYHAHPADGQVPRIFQAGQDLKPGLSGDGNVGDVGPPYGSDMIFAIASTEPLFARPRAKSAEAAGPFLKDLQTAIEAARKRGARLAADVIILDTAAR